MPEPPLSWPLLLLAGAAVWFLAALVVEGLAWRGWRLGRRRAPPSFRGAPRPGPDAERASLAFLGDLQRGVADVAPSLGRALVERPADVFVSSGDFVAHAEGPYYGTLLDAFETYGIDTPTRVVPGNHDLYPRGVRDPTDGYALFRRHFGEPEWAVRVGPIQVVGIDDALMFAAGAHPGPDLARLADARREAAGLPWILVSHLPPRHVQLPEAPISRGLADLVSFLEADPPRLVVSGHQHEYAEREVNGVRYVVNAHGGDVHGLGLLRGPFDLLRVEVGPAGAFRHEITRHRRRPSPRVFLNQLAVRCWWSRRRGGGRLITLPTALVLGPLGLRAPTTDPALALVGVH